MSSPGGRSGAGREDRALVLRRFRYGESSLVVHLLTRRHGRVAALAKGAYRLKSGLFGVLDLFDTLHVAWQPRSSDLGVVRSASIVRRRRALSADLARYRAGLAVLELAGLGARPEATDPALFARTDEALETLAAGRVDAALARTAFDLAFLTLVGLAPALERCASCGERPRDPAQKPLRVPFSVHGGGRLCGRCAAEAEASGRKIDAVPLQWLRIARSLMGATPPALERVRLDARTQAELTGFVERFLEYHLETRPRAWGRVRRRTRERAPVR